MPKLPGLPPQRPTLVDASGKMIQMNREQARAFADAATPVVPISLEDFKSKLGLADIGPQVPNLDGNPMVAVIKELIDDVALAIEQRLGSIAAIRQAGGLYVESLVIQQSRKLHEAAAAAIATVINHPKLKPPELDDTVP